ncbi:MAG: radical SAM protein [Deltaproteobacteria bacterium]|nr:radical SAM protein [Deltaproteobacteria bacterium]
MPDSIISLYRHRLAGEKGAIIKDWGGKISIALAYPNYYRVGMSSLGFQVVYTLFNRREDIVAERFFLPDSVEEDLYGFSGKGILSLESQSALGRFDIIAFSLSFENDYPNILNILELGRIPLKSDERDDSHPLVLAGGITAFLNPEPIAPFIDIFLLGEGEELIDSFIEQYLDARGGRFHRDEILKCMSLNLRSAYVPSLFLPHYDASGLLSAFEPVEGSVPDKIKVAHPGIDYLPVNTSQILTRETEFAGKRLIELSRGCGRSCRFCAAGYVYRPPRFHDESDLVSVLGKMDCQNIGLLSASVLDSPGIENIMELINRKKGNFSVSSLRADLLSLEKLDKIRKGGQRSLAIAPEAGSERLRVVINKHLTTDQILNAIRLVAKTDDFNMRLYFLLGLPTETRDDVAEILELVKSIKHNMIKESRIRGRMGAISLSINCFIPKAFTPFQWFPLDDMSRLKEKQKWLKRAFSREGGVKANFDLPKYAFLQTLLSVGDRRVGSILLAAHRNGGDWLKSFRYSDINPDFFVYRHKDLNERLPWDFIDNGIRKDFLKKEYKLALQGRESEICTPGECDRCGACSG